jgi:hypothetical protein
MAARLRQDLVVIDADASRLRAKLEDLRVEATVEPEAPHRLDNLRIFPDDAGVTDTRLARPPSAGSGQVTSVVDSYAKYRGRRRTRNGRSWHGER